MTVVWQVDKRQLEPGFCMDVDALLSADPATWYVTSGFRGFAEQTALYAQGRTRPGPVVTKARAGQSAHNYGRAIDVVLDGSPAPGLQMCWDWKQAAWLRLRAKIAAHPRLHSGWWWGDWPHIERYNWRTRPTPIVRPPLTV